MTQAQFDRFYKYDELTELLEKWAQECPHLCDKQSIGKSYEGRDLWLMTVTNRATGPAEDKPAFWIDGNIHATEVTGSAAAIYLLNHLLHHYGGDDAMGQQVTKVLDSRAFYVLPRANPDGAELALADQPKYIRSSVRPYPFDEPQEGFYTEDIDGDGRILTMRVADPHGPWQQSDEDPRLLVLRKPDDLGDNGPYYRLFAEGKIRGDYDGVTFHEAPPEQGLDINRNFPYEWRPESDQKGAGLFPTSEPEIRAMVRFITDHPNITGGITYHTYSRVLLRPPSIEPDEKLPTDDLRIYQQIGKKGEELTGYKPLAVYHDFRYHPKEVITGVFDDWLYYHLGVFAWTAELWSLPKAAGVEIEDHTGWFRDHPDEDDLKIAQWVDENGGEDAWVDWYPFEHPQLGPVELGGYNTFCTWRNPPLHLLEAEVAPQAAFALFHASISPKLEEHSLDMESLGGDRWRLRWVVQNTGWLPTNVSEKALERKLQPVEIRLETGEDVDILQGNRVCKIGQLAGRATKSKSWWENDTPANRGKAEWVIQAPVGSILKLAAKGPRCGVIRREVKLG